jgi:hypothetical protein
LVADPARISIPTSVLPVINNATTLTPVTASAGVVDEVLDAATWARVVVVAVVLGVVAVGSA